MPAERAPSISIVLPTRDRHDDLGRVLEALERQETETPFELIVIDDGSEPPLDEALLERFDDATLLRGGGDGPAAARNLGIAAARGDVIAFTDDDTDPTVGWANAASTFLRDHDDHVGVEGPVRSPAFDPLYEHSLENDEAGAYWTCNIAYRRPVLARLGGFLEDFPTPHCEDLDLAYRALEMGPIGFEPEMALTHYPRPMSIGQIAARGRMAGSEVVLFSRHRERFGRASTFPAWLFPITNAIYAWRDRWRADRARLVRSPRRLARFAAAGIGQLSVMSFVAAATALRRTDS